MIKRQSRFFQSTQYLLASFLFCVSTSFVSALPLPEGTLLTIERSYSYWGTYQECGSCLDWGYVDTQTGKLVFSSSGDFIEPGTDGGLIIGKNQLSGGQENGSGIVTPGEMTAVSGNSFDNYTLSTAPVTGAVSGMVVSDASANMFDDQSCSGLDCVGKTEVGTLIQVIDGTVLNLGSLATCTGRRCAYLEDGAEVEQWRVNHDNTYFLSFVNIVNRTSYDGTPVRVQLAGRIIPPPAPAYNPPTAQDVEISGDQGHVISWIPDVYDPDGDPLQCRVFGYLPRVTIAPDCSSGSYDPGVNYAGIDSFNYIVDDGVWESRSATVTVTVNSASLTANDLRLQTTVDTAIDWVPLVTGPGVVNCLIINAPQHGTVTVNNDCSVGTYSPTPGYEGHDWFSYRSTDGAAQSETAYARVKVGEVIPDLLPEGTRLTIDNDFNNQWIPDLGPGIDVWITLYAGNTPGIVIGRDQASGGQEQVGGGSLQTSGELTQPFNFFGYYGTFATAPMVDASGYEIPVGASANIFSASSCSGLDCIGHTELGSWHWAWNELAIPMGSAMDPCRDNSACVPDGRAGIFVREWVVNPDNTYSLRYVSTIPLGHPSGFGGVFSYLYLGGRILPPNNPPIATPVTVRTTQDTPVNWTPVIEDADSGDTLSCYMNNQPVEGMVSLQADCSSGTYTPPPGYTGVQCSIYHANDEWDDSNGAALCVIVDPVCNDPSCLPPAVSGLWSSSATPGSSVFVFGENFQPQQTTVTVDGVDAPLVQVVDGGMLIFIVPDGVISGPVEVTTVNGTAVSPVDFGTSLPGVNITGIWPGTAAVGEFVFVFGSGFDLLNTEVDVNGTQSLLVQVLGDNMLIFMVPAGATSGNVTVNTPSGSATASVPLVIN